MATFNIRSTIKTEPRKLIDRYESELHNTTGDKQMSNTDSVDYEIRKYKGNRISRSHYTESEKDQFCKDLLYFLEQGNSITKAAKLVGIARTAALRLFKEYNIDLNKYKNTKGDISGQKTN